MPGKEETQHTMKNFSRESIKETVFHKLPAKLPVQ